MYHSSSSNAGSSHGQPLSLNPGLPGASVLKIICDISVHFSVSHVAIKTCLTLRRHCVRRIIPMHQMHFSLAGTRLLI